MKNLRLYSPLKVTAFLVEEDEYGYRETSNYSEEVSNPKEYFELIKGAIIEYNEPEYWDNEFNARGIIAYFYDEQDEVSKTIDNKIESAWIDVTRVKTKNGIELYGICDLQIKEDLNDEELEKIKDYLTGQYSDGYGEGFEQQDIKISRYEYADEINVHFWNDSKFYIKTEKEIAGIDFIDLHPPLPIDNVHDFDKNIRLYSPMHTTTFIYDEEEMCYSDYVETIDGVEYYENLKEALKDYLNDDGEEEIQSNIMKYFSPDYSEKVGESIYRKVESAYVSITVLNCNGEEKLFGVCDLKLKEQLTIEEQMVLYEYIEGQYADGIGEGFSQQNIDVCIYGKEREIQSHLWKYDDFYLKTEDEIIAEGYIDLHPPKLEKETEQDNDFNMEM